MYPLWYEKALTALEYGACTAFVSVEDGIFQSLFIPGSDSVERRMLDEPVRFALMVCGKTRALARDNGFTLEDF